MLRDIREILEVTCYGCIILVITNIDITNIAM